MAFATATFSTLTNHRLELGLYITNYTPTGDALFRIEVGVRRMSGSGSSGTITANIGYGTRTGPSGAPGGDSGGPVALAYNTTVNSYQLLHSVDLRWDGIVAPVDHIIASVGVSAASGNTLGAASVSVYEPLPVPSQSTLPSFTPTVFDAGQAVAISLPRKNSAYTHELSYRVGDSAPVSVTSAATTSYTFTPSAATILPLMPNAPEAKFTVIAVTKNGTTIIGTEEFSGTVRAAASASPTVSAYSAVDANTPVSSIVGKFVRGLSTIKLNSVTAAGKNGATIAERRLDIEGASLRVNDTKALVNSGTIPVVARAWDTRGLAGSLAGTIEVLPYDGPSIGLPIPSPTGSNVYRSNSSGVYQDDGAYLAVSMTASVASLVNGTQRNSLTVKISTKPLDGGTWTLRSTITPTVTVSGGRLQTTAFTQLVGGGGVYSPDQSYMVRIEVLDKFNTLVKEETVATSYVAVDLNGSNVGIGKLHTRGRLDVAGDGYFDGLFTNDWPVGDLDEAAFGGAYVYDIETALNLPFTGTGMGRLIVTRTPIAPFNGVEGVFQHVVDFVDPTRILYTRSGMSLEGTADVGWDGPWNFVSDAGLISMHGGATAPNGWLLCQGQAELRSVYPALFLAIGTTYGAGNGSTTFNLPNLKGRVPVGLDAAQTEFNALGESGGEKRNTLTSAEMPPHSHRQYINTSVYAPGAGSAIAGMTAQGFGNAGIAAEQVTSVVGEGASHNNLQPYIVLNYIIKT